MRINVRPVIGQPGEALPLMLNFEQAEIDVSPDECFVSGQILFDGELKVRDEKTVVMTGVLKAQIPGNCDRCGEQLTYDMNAFVEAVFVLKNRNTDNNLNEEQDESYYFDGNSVVPDEALRDYLLLGIPAKILCSENCMGLCTVCGMNLNEGLCDCRTADS